jgi:hypothetical protein
VIQWVGRGGGVSLSKEGRMEEVGELRKEKALPHVDTEASLA